MKKWREALDPARPGFKLLTPEEREAKRLEMKDRVNAHIDGLRKKVADRTITEPEKRRLQRMEKMSSRLARGGSNGLSRLPPPAP